jgi:hypothetical protein
MRKKQRFYRTEKRFHRKNHRFHRKKHKTVISPEATAQNHGLKAQLLLVVRLLF